MRSQLWLLAVASGRLATADWLLGQELDHRGGGVAHHVPRQTQASAHDGVDGFTPKPTDGPSLELARRRQDWAMMRRQTTVNTWVDDTTCGWRADSASLPFTCSNSSTCATNTDQVVGCSSSGGENPFFTVCMDYQAVLGGKCDTIGAKTGCCMTASLGECITYLWPGTPQKSMYRCWTERAILTMLATPAGLTSTSSSTRTTRSSTISSSTISETSTSTTSSPSQSTTAPPSSGGGSNTGAIVGGVVGGVGGVALIAGAIAMFIIRSRKKPSIPGAGTTYSAVAPAEPTPYTGAGGAAAPVYPPSSSVSPQMSQAGGGYFAPGSVGATPMQPGTPYLSTPSPPAAGGGMYDPRTSYYDPAKMAEQQQMQQQQMQQQQMHQQYGGYVPYPGHQPQYPPPGAYAPQAIELDNTTVPAGQQGNPVEMAAMPASPNPGGAPPR
ncbi:hypothetical protein C8A05DRAFT_36665 [Staphylotrichum tortipilum]|uniref:Uncharacterized protein n=1 Tax=Staphylotrichum tortipilum TaxID=2831512 RepID=A0AAN6MGE7_9PEZI|nr:hypothetical protein C8A05DRAFT_36665 [Staphylotrichum longicolle]